MARYQKLDPEEVQSALEKLEGWGQENGKLHRVFKFKDFSQAFGFHEARDQPRGLGAGFEALDRFFQLVGSHHLCVQVDVPLETTEVLFPIKLRVELRGPNRFLRNSQGLERSELTEGQILDPFWNSGGLVFVSELRTEDRRQSLK
jgi:hypothetical protein